MKKFRTIIDMNKEEQFLNDMARKGWSLAKYSSFNIYTFKRTEPCNSNYRIDFREFKNKADYLSYQTLFEDSGWIKVSGNQYSGYQFFLPGKGDQDADIFSDSITREARYKRLYAYAMRWAFLVVLYIMLISPSLKSIPSWYLAPSLWVYSELQLIGMITMETFFLIIQLAPILFMSSLVVYYAFIGYRAKRISQNIKN